MEEEERRKIAYTIITFVTAAGLGVFLYSFCHWECRKMGVFRGLRGEGKEEDLGERISKVLILKCYFIFAKIIFCQQDDRGLRSHFAHSNSPKEMCNRSILSTFSFVFIFILYEFL